MFAQIVAGKFDLADVLFLISAIVAVVGAVRCWDRAALGWSIVFVWAALVSTALWVQ